MPIAAAIIPAVIGAGAAVYSSSQAKRAANKAQEAQSAADEKALALQQENFNRIYGLNQPFVQGGNAAFDRLLQQYGLPVPQAQGQPQTTSAPANYGAVKTDGGFAGTSPVQYDAGLDTNPFGGSPQQGVTTAAPAQGAGAGPGGPAYPGAPQFIRGGVDYAAYGAQNPDVTAEYQRLLSSPEGVKYLASKDINNVQDFDRLHYQTFGQDEGRALPHSPDVTIPDFMNGVRPDAPAAPTYTRPNSLSAPDLASYFSNFQADPGAQYRRDQALDAVNAKSAARGLLRSGSAVKALQDNSSNLASQEYNNWFQRQLARAQLDEQQYQFGQNNQDLNFNNDRAYGTSLWQNNRDYTNNNFNTDRTYQTNRYDTATGDLFDLTRLGLSAAGNVSGAGTNYANSAGNIFNSSANSAADAAYARANANAGLAGSLGGAATNLFTNWGGSSNPTPVTANPYGSFGAATPPSASFGAGLQPYSWAGF